MQELIAVLVVLAIALVVVTVVGHGIWALLALVFGGAKRPVTSGIVCVFCGRRTAPAGPRCEWCGRELHNKLADELHDLQAVERQLRLWGRSGQLGPKTVSHLLARVERYRRELLHPVVAEVVGPAVEKPAAAASLPLAVSQAPARPQAAVVPQAAAKPQAVVITPPAKPQAVVLPPEPRRPWSEMLAGFMEERNIRWGELIGGLLIVGPAIALVISFWDKLAANPYLQLTTFVAVCSAVFGAGLYAHHRWKLRSTSLGLLVIAMLLVPLNFLAMAAVWKENWGLGTLAADLGSLAIFTWLGGLAGRVLVPKGRWLQVLAVVGGSASVLVAARWVNADSPDWWYVTAALLPVVLFAAAIGIYLLKMPARKRLDAAGAAMLYTLLGTAAFAMLVAMGMMVVRSGGITAALGRLAVPVALTAVPVLACGLTVRRGVARDPALAGWHVSGTAVALVGMSVMLAALGLAWPHPLAIMAVAALDGVALVLAAFRWRLPALNAGAIACATLAYLTGFHVIFSGLPLLGGDAGTMARMMLDQITSAASGTALVGPFVLYAIASELLARWGRHRHAVIYAGGAGVMAVLGLMLTTAHGLHGHADAVRAALLYTIYGAGGLALAVRWRRVELSYIGLSLLAAAPLWVLWQDPARHYVQPMWAAVLAVEALAMAAISAVLRRLTNVVEVSVIRKRPATAVAGGEHAASPPATAAAGRLDAIGGTASLYCVPLLHIAEALAPAALCLGAWAAAAATRSPALVAATVCITACYMLLAWQHRSPVRTWIGSMVAMAGLVHAAAYNYYDPTVIQQPWLMALLAHSTLAAVAAVVLGEWSKRRASEGVAGELRRVFSTPLGDTAVLSSVLTLPLLPLATWSSTWSLAGCLYWLAAIWLAIGWRRRNAVLFAACQLMLAAATGVAVTAWLEGQSWVTVTSLARGLWHPYSLQAYGIALGVLSLLWIAARIALRGDATAKKLLDPAMPTVDWLLRHALVAIQLLVVVIYLLPDVGHELIGALPVSAGFSQWQQATFGSGAWLLLGTLAAMLTAALWDHWRRAELVSALLVAASVPCLIAGRFAGDMAVASALRWGLAGCFMAVSAAMWGRKRLLRACRLAHTGVDLDRDGWLAAHGVALATAALPVLILTVAAAGCQFIGTKPGGPAAGTLFDRLGPNLSYLVPLVLVLLAMVGHALRESSAGYAFSAGLVAELAVTLGYALGVVLAQRPFAVPELVTLVQLATITAAVWALVWLAARQWVGVWRENSEGTARNISPLPLGEGQGVRASSATTLMNVQLGMGVAGNAVLIVAAVIALVWWPLGLQQWAIAAGMPLGWIALAGSAAAVAYRRGQLGRRLSANAVGLIGMTALGLLACTIRWVLPLPALGLGPESAVWGYRTLMLGWAAYALLIVLATWWVASLRTLPEAEGPPQALVRAAAVWVRLSGVAAVLLGLKAAFFPHGYDYEDRLWAAAAIAIASGAGATMAVWRRREGWAFSAALGVNLAASLVVWYFHRDARNFAEWWLRLLEANVIASAAVALAWLAAQRRLYQLRQFGLGDSPFLATQVILPAAGTVVMLAMPVAWLVGTPTYLPAWLVRLSDAPGWLALLLTAAAAAWYLGRVLPGNVIHVLSGLVLGAGVLVTCHVGRFNGVPGTGDWLAYHTLMTAWASAALLVLAIAWLAARVDNSRGLTAPGEKSHASWTFRGLLAPGYWDIAQPIVQGWVTAIGTATVALAVMHAHADLAGAWWSIGAIVSIGVAAALLALWLRLPAYVFISALLLNTAGVIGWMAWGPSTLAGLVEVNVLCLAAGSVAWSLLEGAHRAGVPHWQLGGRPLCFAHLAAVAAVGLLVVFVTAGVAGELLLLPELRLDPSQMDWIALAAAAVAVAVCLWDRRAKFVLAGLYFLGLSAAGMALCAAGAGPQIGCWWATSALPAFALAASALGWLLPRIKPVGRLLRVPDAPDRWPVDWFVQSQAVLVAISAVLAAWVSLDVAFGGIVGLGFMAWLAGRLAGPLGGLLLLAAAVVMAAQARGAWRSYWQYASLAAGVLLLGCLGWAKLDLAAGTPTGDAPWLHRSVILMAAAVPVLLLGGLGLGRMLPQQSDWIAAGRRMAPVLGGLSLLSLLAVLVQEGAFFHPAAVPPEANAAYVPMLSPWIAPWAIAVVAAALVALAVGCLVCALVPRWDPLRLSDRGRTAYVYAAEGLLALLGLHLRIAVPGLFRLHLIRTYWMLIVMAVAFCGASLSALFHRRKMPVLSEPLERTALLLPVLPPVGFLFLAFNRHAGEGLWFLGNSGPAFWLLIGLFYGVMAVRKRSLGLAALAVLTGNAGLWVLWNHCGWDFLGHPQLWLIPLALAMLVAEHLDRRRLSESQRTAIRYLALSVIYVSSTTEFWQHIGDSALLPLVTILLAVLGVLAGILLRVRSFLYLGFTFLLVVIGRMIVFAAFEQKHIWIFWTCCIILGAAIIALFAVFEKRRNDVLAALEEFKQWDR